MVEMTEFEGKILLEAPADECHGCTGSWHVRMQQLAAFVQRTFVHGPQCSQPVS